jgi:hypothetical protein
MKKKTVIISTIARVKSQQLTLAWGHPTRNGYLEFISPMFTIEEIPQSEFNNQAMTMDFTADRPKQIVSFMEGALKGTSDYNKAQAMEKLKTNPLFYVNSQPTTHTRSAIYNLDDISDSEQVYMERWNNKLKAANMINEMSDAKRRDLSYYFGFGVSDKTESEVLKLLADFAVGIILASDANIITLLTTWVKGDTTEKTMKIAMEKALALGIISKRKNGENDMYYHGQNPIGMTKDDILAYFRKEEKIFQEYILREINEKDIVPSESVVPSGEVAMEQLMRDLASGLKQGGFLPITFTQKTAKFDKLKSAIKIALTKKSVDGEAFTENENKVAEFLEVEIPA